MTVLVGRDRISRALRGIPELLGELDVTLSRTDAIGDPDTRSASRPGPERSLPYHIGASNVRGELVRVLRELVVQAGSTPGSGPEQDAAHLFARLPELTDDSPVLSGLAQVLVPTVEWARRVIDRPAERFTLGICECGVALHAADEAETVDCRCGRTHDVRARRNALLAQAQSRLGTAAELARLVTSVSEMPLTAALIRQWAARGKLAKYEIGGRTVYRIGDVLRLHHRPPAPTTRGRGALLVRFCGVTRRGIGLQPQAPSE
ncbi:DUF1922 domain-containing protein [Nocardia sp. BMG111209]|uniref:DUF1922 domain-containing protein n=1 Tax=Nocardia sp. BMG111209 TaxID=1160137 RepID=UPI00037C6707|nr:DUF1922 domain-containing protein [Nocardia sp. BMG111209]